MQIEILGKTASELMEISKSMILSLNEEEMKAVQDHYRKLGRNPTEIEIESIAQTWSEHCKHKIFSSLIEYEEGGRKEEIDGLFSTYIRKATEEIGRNRSDLVSVFKDNAGIVSFDGNHDIAFKAETHNHPSALDPFGGASTGVGGVIRDVLGAGLGAKPIFSTDVFCFAPPDSKEVPEGVLHPKRILRGVVAGVRDYGNPIGIPTINGSVQFHESYMGSPLVFCGTVGIMPKGMHEKKVEKGDLIVVIGGRTGRDGIHGATFSSAELKKDSPTSAVQIGAPIEEKKVIDVVLKARDRRLYNHITDCGGGGFSSAIGETAKNGCIVYLDKVPLKYSGLEPWEIWLSESQERMILSIKAEKLQEFLEICSDEDVEAAVIGEHTNDKMIILMHKGKPAGELDCEFLHNGVPKQKRRAVWAPKKIMEPDFPEGSTEEWLKRILSSWTVCSKEFIIRQYDHEVQANTVLKPLAGYDGPSDAAVVKPLNDSSRCIAVSNGINPLYSTVDAYWMAASCIDEALRNIIASGGSAEKTFILDNFCAGSPDEEKLGEVVRAAKACYDFATAFGVPFISGKDSFYNEFRAGSRTIPVPSTLLISAISVTEAERITSMDAKEAGNLVYALGETLDELGGSQYYYLQGFKSGNVPRVNAAKAKKLFSSLSKAMGSGLVRSCHDCSEGGLAVALAEMAFAGNLGMKIDLRKAATELKRNDKIMFSESNSRFVVEVRPDKKEQFEKNMEGSAISNIGNITEERNFAVTGLDGKIVCNVPIEELKEAWQRPMKKW